tara:strand:- start:1335 stop:2282 length:948 start_codon:yes stop_codon:yes gene_type:complete
MKGATLNYENYFFLNNSTISGIISVDGGYSINYAPIKTIGVGYNKQVIAEVPVANFSINKYLLYNEPFLNFTGENKNRNAIGFKGSLNYNNKKFGFLSGYLNSFGLSCAVGQTPTTKSDIIVYGDVGPNYNASGDLKAPYISVPQIKDIILTCSGSSTNRITDFNYNINCTKKPIYILNQSGYNSYSGPTGPTEPGPNYVPYEVLLNLPIEIDASFTLEVDDYTSRSLYDILNNDNDTSFSININGTVFADEVLMVNGQNLIVNGGSDLLLYKKLVGINMFNQSFNNVKLTSQEFNSSAEDVLSVKLSYKGYLNN